jgi:hypothetical protein
MRTLGIRTYPSPPSTLVRLNRTRASSVGSRCGTVGVACKGLIPARSKISGNQIFPPNGHHVNPLAEILSRLDLLRRNHHAFAEGL